jgi:hypothetical protein
MNNVVEFVSVLPIIIIFWVGSKAPHEIFPRRTPERCGEKALEKIFPAVASVREWEMQNTSRALQVSPNSIARLRSQGAMGFK